MRYIPNTDADRREMLAAIGRPSLAALFEDIPQTVRDRYVPLGLRAHSEVDVVRLFAEWANQNAVTELVPFVGGGIYDHYTPAVVKHLAGRSEFYTAYTPYQPEISQGTLTAMFEFQTIVCELTGMEIANASMYDGATATAEAALMAERIRGRGRIAVSKGLFQHVRRVVDTYCWAAGIERVDLPIGEDGRTVVPQNEADVSAVILQTPNAAGVVETLRGVKEAIGDALLIVSADPVSLAVLEPPGALGADVVTGEGQALGLPMAFGGPLLGLFATRRQYLRQMPGRVAGRTVDVNDATGYTMAAQTREQHIRRERATSNICTNSALCALMATMYAATLGADGLRTVAKQCLAKAHDLADRIAELPGFSLPFESAFFNEFVVSTSEPAAAVAARARKAGFLIGVPDLNMPHVLGAGGGVRIAVTEKRTKPEMDRLIAVLEGAA